MTLSGTMSTHLNQRPPEPKGYGIRRAADCLDVSPGTVRRWIRSGVLHSVRIGGRRIVPQHAIEAALRDGIQLSKPKNGK